MKTFKDLKLSEDIQKSLLGLGYSQPTPVQAQVIPAIMSGDDVIVQSKTGSGKTASFGIPLSELVQWEENKPQAIILTPTRELALQIKEELSHIGRFKRLKVAAVYGKSPFKEQIRELKQKTHIVVGTPGRVLDHLERGTLSFEKIQYVVLDEADEMLRMGFVETVETILNKAPRNTQNLLFSATMPDKIRKLSTQYLEEPQDIIIKSENLTTDTVTHELYEVTQPQKFWLLKDLTTVDTPKRAMIFCSTKDAVETLYQALKDNGYPVERLHGGLEQRDRFETMKRFKLGAFTYLVATDVAARGIDVSNVTHVYNYDMPQELDSFVHRIGRAGRAGEVGKAITFVTPFETKWLRDVEAHIGFELPHGVRPTEDEVVAQKETFESSLKLRPTLVKQKVADANREIMKLYINGGKKKKLRAIDFVGTITSIEGIVKEDIGIIDIQDNVTYIDILNGKGWDVIDGLKTRTIKGKKVKVQKAYR